MNKPSPTTPPTPGELAILQVLWTRGPLPVKDVQEALEAERAADDKPVGYTTVLKLMQLMTEKGLLDREADGRKHIYRAIAERAPTQDRLLDTFLERAFAGSAQTLVMRALGKHTPTADELDELKSFIADLERGQNPDA